MERVLKNGMDKITVTFPPSESVQAEEVCFSYSLEEGKLEVLKDVSIEAKKGQHIALLGRNGSGKSTLAKLLNALEIPERGRIRVQGREPIDEKSVLFIRQHCGMVFQNPENQMIGTTVEEEIAFGPENLGIEPSKIRKRIEQCMKLVGLPEECLTKHPSSLSGGQKQKLAIAGVLAMEPRVIVLDESTSMLDPLTRQEFLKLCEELRARYALTFINITHHMEEVLLADYVYVMDKGKIILQGCPKEVFQHVELLKGLGLDLPCTNLVLYSLTQFAQNYRKEAQLTQDEIKYYEEYIRPLLTNRETTLLQESNIANEKEKGPEDKENLDHEMKRLYSLSLHMRYLLKAHDQEEAVIQNALQAAKLYLFKGQTKEKRRLRRKAQEAAQLLLEVKDLSYTYPTMGEHSGKALEHLSFQMKKGEILGVMGHTGSGKSTLMQHLNGLIRPQTGEIQVLGLSTKENKGVREIRKYVGLLFQYSEHQLFAETVKDDIAYGLRIFSLTREEQEARIEEACAAADVDKSWLSRSPFELSGGQKRRVALASILVMKPELLILDEPAAGLDPQARNDILSLVLSLNQRGVSILMVSHSMEDLARICDRFIVLEKGKLVLEGRAEDVFVSEEKLRPYQLSLPASAKVAEALRQEGLALPRGLYSEEDLLEALLFSRTEEV